MCKRRSARLELLSVYIGGSQLQSITDARVYVWLLLFVDVLQELRLRQVTQRKVSIYAFVRLTRTLLLVRRLCGQRALRHKWQKPNIARVLPRGLPRRKLAHLSKGWFFRGRQMTSNLCNCRGYEYLSRCSGSWDPPVEDRSRAILPQLLSTETSLLFCRCCR